MKNLPRVPRPPTAPSPYSKGGKTPFPYSTWVRERRDPPPQIRKELEMARRNPKAFKMRREGTPAPTA